MEPNPMSPVPLTTATTQVEIAVKQPSIARRRVKSILIILLSALLLFVSLVMAFHAYIAWTLARPHIDPLKSNPTAAIGVSYQNIQFPSLNNSSILDGWYIPAAGSTASTKTVVFSHGYGGNREEIWVPLYDLAKELHQQNYNVVMFDYGFVQPKESVTGGIRESQELLGAVKYAREHGAKQVYVWGFSMGAGTALQAALLSDDIDGMILDSTFILEPDTVYHNMKQVADLPKFPTQPLVYLFFPLINGVSLNQIPYNQVKETKYNIPIFFIHGKQDLKAPYEMAQEIFQNQPPNSGSQLWLLPKDSHELIYRAHPKTYLSLTMGFLRTLSSSHDKLEAAQ